MAELEQSFPGWLLPASARRELTAEAAERFFSRLTGRRDHLQMLRAASLLQAEHARLTAFLGEQLPALLRVLPARSEVVTRTSEGGFHGRLDIRATQQLHRSGQPTRFVTRSRRRDLALPENLLVRYVCDRLAVAFDRVLSAAPESRHWLAPIAARAHALQRLQQRGILREIPPLGTLTGRHLTAARQAGHPAYQAAASLAQALHDGLDSTDPARVAPFLAAGALWPISTAKRFELAVLCRLVDRVAQHLGVSNSGEATPAGCPWTVEHHLFFADRTPAVTFRRSDGAYLEIWADRAPPLLRPGRRYRLATHYLGASLQRPDLSIRRHVPGQRDSWALVEIKLTHSASYVATGLGEALLYHHEYGAQLGGWPQVVLVTSRSLLAPPSGEDPVVAVSWEDWADPVLVSGLLGSLAPATGTP